MRPNSILPLSFLFSLLLYPTVHPCLFPFPPCHNSPLPLPFLCFLPRKFGGRAPQRRGKCDLVNSGAFWRRTCGSGSPVFTFVNIFCQRRGDHGRLLPLNTPLHEVEGWKNGSDDVRFCPSRTESWRSGVGQQLYLVRRLENAAGNSLAAHVGPTQFSPNKTDILTMWKSCL